MYAGQAIGAKSAGFWHARLLPLVMQWCAGWRPKMSPRNEARPSWLMLAVRQFDALDRMFLFLSGIFKKYFHPNIV
jgi:hypothetical protein